MAIKYLKFQDGHLCLAAPEEAGYCLVPKEEHESKERMLQGLLRITRERANAARQLRPKKQHGGYLLLSSRPWTERFEASATEPGYEDMEPDWLLENGKLRIVKKEDPACWLTTLQTPYNGDLSNEIMLLVEQDFERLGLLRELGITAMNGSAENGCYLGYAAAGSDTAEADELNAENRLYRWRCRFRASLHSAFWEVELFTTGAVRIPSGWIPVTASG